MDIQVVVMAGGVGSRFWPLSRARRPKQFLSILSRKSMLEETVERLLPLAPWSHIWTVANAGQTQTIRKLLPRLPGRNALVEPEGRNTAPSLILATAAVAVRRPGSAVIVLPSDHLITDSAVFLRQLESGAGAASRERALVTFGIKPSFPATGYGYIRVSAEPASTVKGFPFHRVLEFKEKPGLDDARAFMAAGDYYWNSGMFVWTPEVFAAQLETHAPDFFPHWQNTLAALKKKDRAALAKAFKAMPAKSIDYALMEKASKVYVCPARFGWSDVGAWSSLIDIWAKDSGGNAARGETVSLDSGGSLVHNPGRLTALVGVRDLIIVNTPDALLICRKDQDQRVKEVIAALAKSGKKSLL